MKYLLSRLPALPSAWALPALLLAFSILFSVRATAAVYQLPGKWDTTTLTYPNGDPRNGLHQVARDSNGFWYVVWENASQTDIVMAYTTTNIPTAAGHWGLVTLVDNSAGGVIDGTPAENDHGSRPNICMGLDDTLHFVWERDEIGGLTYHTYCTDLAYLKNTTGWRAPLLVGDLMNPSLALDYKGSAHVAGLGRGSGGNPNQVLYARYDTATDA